MCQRKLYDIYHKSIIVACADHKQ